jgi:hypothetical protein
LHPSSVLAIEGKTLMAIGRPIPVLTLSDNERETLERWTRRPTTAQALAQRARLVLAFASGRTNTQVARERRLTKQTVGSGAVALWPRGSTGCWMSPVLEPRDALPMRRSSRW